MATKTFRRPIQFVHTVTSGEASAGSVAITVTNTTPSDDFIFVAFAKTNANKEKAGLVYSYNKSTGVLTVAKDGATVVLEEGDVITISGTFIKL